MFGIDSSEFLLIAVVALLVIGPKDLPRVMRLVGGWVGRGRAMTRHLRAGFDTMMREAELEEMQKQWAQQNAEIMVATATAPVAAHAYDPPVVAHAFDPPVVAHGSDTTPAGADAVVTPHRFDHPGALPVDTVAMTGPQPAAHALPDHVTEPAIPLEHSAVPPVP